MDSFNKTFNGHKLCSSCNHELSFHDKTDWAGRTLPKPQCTKSEDCKCGKEPDLPNGYFEVARKCTAAMVGDIVLGKTLPSPENSAWVTMRYNPATGNYNRMHYYIGSDSETRARQDYEKRWN